MRLQIPGIPAGQHWARAGGVKGKGERPSGDDEIFRETTLRSVFRRAARFRVRSPSSRRRCARHQPRDALHCRDLFAPVLAVDYQDLEQFCCPTPLSRHIPALLIAADHFAKGCGSVLRTNSCCPRSLGNMRCTSTPHLSATAAGYRSARLNSARMTPTTDPARRPRAQSSQASLRIVQRSVIVWSGGRHRRGTCPHHDRAFPVQSSAGCFQT